MKYKNRIFKQNNNTNGNILVELLLSVALAIVIIPFTFQYQQQAVVRAENVALGQQMKIIQDALERYIIANRETLLKTVGKNITRVEMDDLAEYGIPDALLTNPDNQYQMRIIKSSDNLDNSTLQGIIVRASDDISPMRTREIVNLSGGNMGFVDNKHAYGTFGVWHTDAIDLGIDMENGIIQTTSVNRDNALYLWRIPSDNPDDATMLSAFSLGGHDITNIKFLNTARADFSEDISAQEVVAKSTIFQNRTALDKLTQTTNAVVSGMMSSDSKTLEVAGTFTLNGTGKFSSLTTENLWAHNMTLGGLSISSYDGTSDLKINQTLDMTGGRIEALYINIGYDGSMTSRLVVNSRIEDTNNPEYYWDASSKTAHFADVIFIELNRMAELAIYKMGDKTTSAYTDFSSVAANKNATVSDYMNAIEKIQKRVTEKYQRLQLQ